jgi:hypothetical protein
MLVYDRGPDICLGDSHVATQRQTTAFPSNGTDYDYMVYVCMYVCMYVVVNNDEMPTAPPLRPEAADVESSARPLVSGLWESAWPAAEMGRCTWPTRVGTDFEDDDGDTVVLQAYGTVIMYIYRR